jgi:hypothetical protein
MMDVTSVLTCLQGCGRPFPCLLDSSLPSKEDPFLQGEAGVLNSQTCDAMVVTHHEEGIWNVGKGSRR